MARLSEQVLVLCFVKPLYYFVNENHVLDGWNQLVNLRRGRQFSLKSKSTLRAFCNLFIIFFLNGVEKRLLRGTPSESLLTRYIYIHDRYPRH